MPNPSTVWAQLSVPNSPIGSIPFVDTDGQSIISDVSNLSYSAGNLSSYATGVLPYQLKITNGLRVAYSDLTAAPSVTVTINKAAGRIKIPAGQTTVTVTSNCCFATSIVHLQLESADATLTRVIAVPAAGSFTITGNAACTAATTVNFIITNVL